MEKKSLMPTLRITRVLCCTWCKIYDRIVPADIMLTSETLNHTHTNTHKQLFTEQLLHHLSRHRNQTHAVYPSSSLRMLSRSFSAFQAWSFSFLVGVRFFCLAAMIRRNPSMTSLSDTRTLCLSSCLRISSLANLGGSR